MTTTRTVTGLTPDTDYKFKVAAQNIHGWTPSNSTESTVARTQTTVPDAVTNVQTTVSSSGLGVDITWNAYVSNGLSVTKVKVYIKQDDGSYSKDLVNCDGETDSSIVTNRKCTIPFTTLRATPYFLDYSDEVVANVYAENADGWSSVSADSTGGALIQIEPT